MDIVQLIGFFISFAALMYMSIKRSREQKRRAEHPEEFEDEQREEEQAYKDLLAKLELPIPKELQHPSYKEHPPAVPKKARQASKGWKAPEVKRQVSPTFQFQAKLDARHQKNQIEQRNYQNRIDQRRDQFRKTVVSESMQWEVETDAYVISDKQTIPYSREILSQLKSPIQMVLFHEILSKPKGSGLPGPLQGLPWETR